MLSLLPRTVTIEILQRIYSEGLREKDETKPTGVSKVIMLRSCLHVLVNGCIICKCISWHSHVHMTAVSTALTNASMMEVDSYSFQLYCGEPKHPCC